MDWPFGRRERLRRQAADWVARLNGPHDGHDRQAFEAWYRAHPEHAAVYDRVAALFDVAAELKPAAAAPDRGGTQPRPVHRGPAVRYALAGSAALLVVAALAIAMLGGRMPSTGTPTETANFAASASEARHLVLSDGSEVVLAPGSALEVTIDGDARRLRLRRGEGRFTVFPDGRPFVVQARDAEIRARGTQFTVRLGHDGTLVELFEGRVEVSYPALHGTRERRVAELAPGERVVVPADVVLRGANPVTPAGMIDFDDVRLADAVARINGQAGRRVRLADPALGELRVTGAFRAGDAPGFADGTAVALGLRVRSGSDGALWLVQPGPD